VSLLIIPYFGVEPNYEKKLAVMVAQMKMTIKD
jgi:hypothetical protein